MKLWFDGWDYFDLIELKSYKDFLPKSCFCSGFSEVFI